MPKLHLVAITPDNKALVLSEQAESNRGDLVLDIDDRLLDAIDRAQRQRARDEGQKLSSAALPTRRETAEPTGERPSPRQIQERLRAGETVAAIAKSGGIDETWVERFAAPVLAELEQVANQARTLTFTKPRVGPSRTSLGESVAANVVDRGIEMTDEEIDAAWSAYQRPGGSWMVAFSLPVKGRRQKAEWSVDLGTGDLVARNKLATELGFRESTGRAGPKPAPAKAATAKPDTKPAGEKTEAAKPESPKSEVPKAEAPRSSTPKPAARQPGPAEATAPKPAPAEATAPKPAPAEATAPKPAPAEATAPEPARAETQSGEDGVQTLPGTVPEGEPGLEQVLDSVAIAPAPPPARPTGEADPTMEVSLPAQAGPDPATPRPRPEPPSPSPS